MASKNCVVSSSLLLPLIFSSFLHLGFSDPTTLDDLISSEGGNIQCMEKLSPCRPYLKASVTGIPPPECCEPLMKMVSGDSDCLCNVFNDAQMLQSMNVTQEDALRVPKACGTEADVSKCKQAASSKPISSSSTIPSGYTAIAEKEKESTSKSSSNVIVPFGVYSFAALMIALGFSAY